MFVHAACTSRGWLHHQLLHRQLLHRQSRAASPIAASPPAPVAAPHLQVGPIKGGRKSVHVREVSAPHLCALSAGASKLAAHQLAAREVAALLEARNEDGASTVRLQRDSSRAAAAGPGNSSRHWQRGGASIRSVIRQQAAKRHGPPRACMDTPLSTLPLKSLLLQRGETTPVRCTGFKCRLNGMRRAAAKSQLSTKAASLHGPRPRTCSRSHGCPQSPPPCCRRWPPG